MEKFIDPVIVVCYLLFVLGISMYLSWKYNKASKDSEFLTGGNHMNWKQTGMTLIAMMFDPGIMGNTALAFVMGFYVVQWNAVNIWFTSWFAGMFFIGIYWRTKIVTTPEYLEKRFNPAARGVFSVVMAVMLVSFLSYGVYNGGILLNEFFGWNLWISIIALAGIAGFYVILGGLRTMLTMDVFQGVLLLLTMFAVGIVGIVKAGGLEGIKEMTALGQAGNDLQSLIPPLDFSLTTDVFYPTPTIITFCAIAGLSWIICNFGMAQRLLASKNETHAQKALIVAGVFNVFTLIFAYLAGVAMRKLMPEVAPDKSFITLLSDYFPVGVRGLLIVGLMAALLSTIDGLLSSSSTLLNQDVYKRFLKPKATNKHLKMVTRITQLIIIVLVFVIINFVYLEDGKVSSEGSAYQILLEFLGSIMGVLIAIFILGIFFRRTTGKASFIAMLVGIGLGFYLLYGLVFGHRVNELTINNIESKYVPVEIYSNLEDLPEKNYENSKSFMVALKEHLGEETATKYRGQILQKTFDDSLKVFNINDATLSSFDVDKDIYSIAQGIEGLVNKKFSHSEDVKNAIKDIIGVGMYERYEEKIDEMVTPIKLNFAHVGTIQFLVVIILGFGLSFLEKRKTDNQLENLTVWTIPGLKGPWIGLNSWPGLWKWAIALPTFWFLLTLLWEYYISR